MPDFTTVQLRKSVVRDLKRMRSHPRQTYTELIARLVELARKAKGQSQYDEFLHRIQRAKMRELWDNTADEEWERA